MNIPTTIERHHGLASAEDAVRARPSAARRDLLLSTCPRPRPHIEVEITDEQGEPVSNLGVELHHRQHGRLRACTTVDGVARFEGLRPESLSLHLPELHEDAWILHETQAIPVAQTPVALARWEPAVATTAGPPLRHTVAPGECIASLGHRYGVVPEALWADPDNEALRQQRDDGHVLHPGDALCVPRRGTAAISVQPGHRYRIRRRGAPVHLRLRLLDTDGSPRARLQYLLHITTERSGPVADREGVTDEQGMLVEPIPPDAEHGELVLGTGETLRIALGRVLPVELAAGIWVRLVNLGYLQGGFPGTLGRRGDRALRAFQRDAGLRPTGVADDRTKTTLVERHGC